jgi:hypothetical protein
VQKRLHDRKRGIGIDDGQMSMIEALSLQAGTSIEFSDSDAESMHSATSLHTELMLQQASWRDDDDREEDEPDAPEDQLGDETAEGYTPMNDELDDESVGGTMTLTGDEDVEGVDESELRDQFGVAEGRTSQGKSNKKRESKRDNDTGGKYGMRKPTASFLAYCSTRRETRVALNGLYGTDSASLTNTSGSLSNSLASGSHLDLSAMAMRPSEMLSLGTDSDDDSYTVGSSTLYSASDVGSQNGDRSRAHSLASLHAQAQAQAQSQGGPPATQQVLNIPSPTQRAHSPSGRSGSPFGGSVGDKARFSQFVASGKKLGSFAKGYLLRHDMNSGLSMDTITGGSRAVNSILMSPATTTSAMQLAKSGTHRSSRSAHQLGGIAELSVNTNASVGDLSLMGKMMSTPSGAAPKTRSAYQLLTPTQRSERKVPKKQSQRSLKHASSAGHSGGEDSNETPAAVLSSDKGERERAASHDSVELVSATEKRGVTSAKVSGKRGANVVDLTPVDQSTAADPVSGTGDQVVAEGGEHDPSKYFNVRDTQVKPYFRPEVTDELLAMNRGTGKSIATDLAHLSGGNSKPGTPKAVIPIPKALVLDERAAFLVVESQPPPVEQRTVLQPVSPTAAARKQTEVTAPVHTAGTSTRASNATSPVASSRLSRTGTADFRPPAFSRNLSEILPPEIGVEVLSPAPRLAHIESLLASAGPAVYHSKRMVSVSSMHASGASNRSLGSEKPSVATISIPLSPAGSGYYPNASNSPTRPALSRTNSNLSFADSDVSYDSHEHKRSMESIYSTYDQDRSIGAPSLTKRFHPDMPPSFESAYSDTLSSPPLSRQYPGLHPKQGKLTKVNPSVVLDPLRSPSPNNNFRIGSTTAMQNGADLEHSVHSAASQSHSKVKRGTNQAIRQSYPQPAKPEFATFPQSMYYSVVRNALDLRPQPNYNPSWDHRRASKNVRLSTLRNPRSDVNLSLTTAPITFSSARKIEDVIRNADHQRRLLIGTIPAERMKTPTNSLRKAPLMINITASADGGDQAAGKLGSALDASQSQMDSLLATAAGRKSPSQAGSLVSEASGRGSPVLVTSFGETAPGPVSKRGIPAPDALLQSIVELDQPLELSDELQDELSMSVGEASKPSHGTNISLTGSIAAKSINSASTPHLLLKPIVSTVPLSTHNSPDRSRSPDKGLFVDHKGKLQSREVQELKEKRELFQNLRNIDVSKNAGLSTATIQEKASHVVEKTATLMPIKHPYLTMNGTKHVLPDKMVASILHVRNSVQDESELSATESVFLGNSASVMIRDSTIGHSSDISTHNIPWLPGGSLDLPDSTHSNRLLGLRDKLELQRHIAVDATRRGVTLRSQNAIRGAFEQYVQQGLHSAAHAQPLQFNQLSAQQQQLLLQQYEVQTDKRPLAQVARS